MDLIVDAVDKFGSLISVLSRIKERVDTTMDTIQEWEGNMDDLTGGAELSQGVDLSDDQAILAKHVSNTLST